MANLTATETSLAYVGLAITAWEEISWRDFDNRQCIQILLYMPK